MAEFHLLKDLRLMCDALAGSVSAIARAILSGTAYPQRLPI